MHRTGVIGEVRPRRRLWFVRIDQTWPRLFEGVTPDRRQEIAGEGKKYPARQAPASEVFDFLDKNGVDLSAAKKYYDPRDGEHWHHRLRTTCRVWRLFMDRVHARFRCTLAASDRCRHAQHMADPPRTYRQRITFRISLLRSGCGLPRFAATSRRRNAAAARALSGDR